MKRLGIFIAWGLLTTSAFGYETFYTSDFSSKRLKALNELSGEYKNKRGDALSISLNFLEESGQQDLFGPRKFRFSGSYASRPNHYDYYEVDLNTFEVVGKNKYSFSEVEDDCDDPGCANYEVHYLFQKNMKGQFYVTIDISVNVHAEDLYYIFDDNSEASDEELEKALNEGCKEMYGRNAQVDYFTNSYRNQDVYCSYSEKVFLKKS